MISGSFKASMSAFLNSSYSGSMLAPNLESGRDMISVCPSIGIMVG